MKLQEHVIASVVVSGGVYLATRSKILALVSFFTGVFLDIDHVADYWIEHPMSFNVGHFFEIFETCRIDKTYLWFHSLELFLPLAAVTVLTRSEIMLGLSIGFAQHMLFDSIFNFIYPTSYFLYYRWSKGFASEHVFNKTDLTSK